MSYPKVKGMAKRAPHCQRRRQLLSRPVFTEAVLSERNTWKPTEETVWSLRATLQQLGAGGAVAAQGPAATVGLGVRASGHCSLLTCVRFSK